MPVAQNRLFVLTLIAMTAFATTATADDEDDEATLRHFKTVLWPKAYREQDVELLDRLLHDSFEMISANGERSTKQDELEYIRNNAWTAASFEFRIERLDIYDGSTAIISGQGITDTYTYRSSNILIKVNGQWRAIASHVSGVKDRDPPDQE